MADQFDATNIGEGKGTDEFLEVEKLIKETLSESKSVKEEPVPAPKAPEEKKKSEFKATSITLPKKELSAEARPVPRIPKGKGESNPPPELDKYDATFKEYKVGDIVKGKVLQVDQSGVLVDINYKADGIIPPGELSEKSSIPADQVVKVGDIINVFIENLENKEGYAVLSKVRADQETRWRLAYEAYKKKSILEGKVIQAVRGGLVVDCEGVRGFIPASQVQKKTSESLDSFKDKVLPVKVIEINRRQGKIVLSHKQAAGQKDKVRSFKILDELEVGQIRKGKVSSLKNFGAFVDLGGMDGLIHLSELSWKRVKHPSEVLKVGQELEVFVLGVDKVNKKIALGLKELQPDPWEMATEYFKPGQIVKVKILRFAKFGAFADIGHGLEGLIHISEMSKEPIQDPGDAAKIDDEVEVKILRVLPEQQKIGLSIKAAIIKKEKEKLSEVTSSQPEQKVTIGDMIAEKEKALAEKEDSSEASEEEEKEKEAPARDETNDQDMSSEA
ncbi:MAG: 30S ribosomal protein S1 [Candidatus Margulisiibacteriota bacterium]|nr:30S ribosomal protein S1 [Candidatus Margulisiibacteriota bacterium]